MRKRDEFFTDDGELVPGFTGIGSFVGKRAEEFSREEQIVLSHFYTNVDSNVYCAKDNMSSELWALVMGQFARSHLSAKERTIQLFRDVHKKDPDNVPPLEYIADVIQRGSSITSLLESHERHAGRFVSDYGVKYGHASLRDSGVIRIIFEGVSQRATKFIESAREGAYQEKSTRALRFIGVGMPLEVEGTIFEERFRELFGNEGKVAALYKSVGAAAETYLQSEYGHLREEADVQIRNATGISNAGLTDREWNGVIKAKAFDIARSLLPQHALTSLGVTLNTRRFQDQLTEWQSSEFEEMRILGRAAQIEAMKIMPSLMKYGNSSEFVSDLSVRRRELNKRLVPLGNSSYQHVPISSRLIAHTPNLEDWILASILFNGSNSSDTLEEFKNKVSLLTSSERREIARSQFDGKRSYELIPKSMEVGSLTFERTIDIGAYRDVQRQRGDRQQATPYTTFAYHMPAEISSLGGDLESRFHDALIDVKTLHDNLVNAGMHSSAEYVPLMANTIRHVVTEDPVQAMYFAKLRAQAAGADSYRTVAIQETDQLLDLIPSFRGLVEYDSTPSYALNRLPETIRMATDRVLEKATPK